MLTPQPHPLRMTQLPAVQARKRLQGFVNQARTIGPLPEEAYSAAVIRQMAPEHVGMVFLTFDEMWPQEAPSPQPGQLSAGDVLHGDCGEIFGHLHEGCVRVVEVGDDWIVGRCFTRDQHGAPDWSDPLFTCGPDVLARALTSRDAGPQRFCRTSFEHGCANQTG